MKFIRGKTGLWLAATIATAAFAFARGQDASQTEKAERILNNIGAACHNLRKIQTQALDEEGWTKIVNSMVEKGGKVPKDDIPLFVNYLVDTFGPLPEGKGKDIVL